MADEDMMNDIDNENLLNQDTNSQEGENIEDYVSPLEGRGEAEEDQVRVEDLPFDRRVQLAKNIHNPFGTVKPGLWVDALDSINSWLSATIEEVDDNTIKVHFDGWPHKWDEWMKITSYKVAPFRKHSIGYTGQTKVAIRKNDLTAEQYRKMIEKMDICIKNNLKGLGALDTTQFYRGTVFTALDHLMGKTYEQNEADLFDVAIDFIKKSIELVTTYFRLVPDMLTQFAEAKRYHDLYLVDENIAVALCYREFTDMLRTIFCGNARTLKFYLKYDRAPQDIKTEICKPFRERDFDMQRMKMEDLDFDEIRELIHRNKDLDFGLFHEFLDHFQQHGGFDSLRKAIKSIVPFENEYTLPLEIIPTITSPFKNCASLLNPDYATEMATELQSIVIGRLENMSDEEMKDVEKATINHLLVELRDFLCMGLEENIVDEKLESVKLSMALRFLRSSNMKKRLNGITEIKNIIEMTSDSIRRTWQDEDQPRKARWLKPEYLCKWIQENHLLEYLLGESSHIEVIKRSTSVLKFLSHNRQLTKEHLDLLWKCQEDKHEATVLGVYETINDITLDLDKDALDYIFTKIESIPLKKYNEQTVNFVRDFTSNACRVAKQSVSKDLVELSSDGEEEEEKNNEYYLENAKGIVEGTVEPPKNSNSEYGLPILYELMQQNTELGSHAQKALLDILKYNYFNLFKMPYILKAIKNMRDGVAVHQSLNLIVTILPKTFSPKGFEKTSQLQIAILQLHACFDFISLTIKNIERYNALVQKSMVDSVNKGIVPENISKTCFEGNVQHADHLEKLLEFIDFLSVNTVGEITLGNENIEKLWNIFVNRSGIEFDKNLFYRWLNKEKFVKSAMQTPHNRRIFTSEEREFLFKHILCKPEYVNIKELSYN
jgi:hypothetical protein